MTLITILAQAATLVLVSGCSTVKYLAQAGKGQWKLSNKTRPIEEILLDVKQPTRTKILLKEIEPVKHFGEKMGLKATKNYSDYVDLGDQPAVVWVVSACRPLKFESKVWGFPLVGSFTYLGWFDRTDAVNFSESISKDGWDVDVRGAGAYSTLGWFKDPVLSTMIESGDSALSSLVNVILHESVHATFYIENQSVFNESIASFVADELTPEYLKATRGEKSPELTAFFEQELRHEKFLKRFHDAYLQLDQIYSSSDSDLEKLKNKAQIIDQLKTEFSIKRNLSNASIVQFKTYDTGKEQFRAFFEASQKDWPRFWQLIKKIERKHFDSDQMNDFSPVLKKFIGE